MSTDLVGNTLEKPNSLGTISGLIARKERIGGTDRKDFYSFNINSRSVFTTSLAQLKVNANLALLNSAGQLLANSRKKSTSPEFINTTLESGKYYIRLSSRSKQATSYKLTLSSASSYSVQVLSPSFNDTLSAGDSTWIRWTDNISENVKIDLYKMGAYYRPIAISTLNDGIDIWSLPSDLIPGSNYQIRIASTTNSNVYDYSGYFSVVTAYSQNFGRVNSITSGSQ